jgi:hypothetical protein
MRYLQRGAATVFGLSAAALILFVAVKGTKPAGSAVLPVMWGALGASALIWLIAEGLKWRDGHGLRLTSPPALSISVGTGSNLHQVTTPGDYPEGVREQADKDGYGKLRDRVRTVLIVSEMNGVRAEAVEARVVDGESRQSLDWAAGGATCEFAPHDQNRLIMVDAFVFEPGRRGMNGLLVVLPNIPSWSVSQSVDFAVELLNADQGTLGHGRFRMTATNGALAFSPEPHIVEIA